MLVVTLLGPGRLPPAGTTEWGLRHRRGHDPCHGASAVPESTRALSVTAGSDGGSRGRRLRVYAHDPRHVAAAVPWYHCGSDGHGAGSSASGGAGGPRKERTVTGI